MLRYSLVPLLFATGCATFGRSSRDCSEKGEAPAPRVIATQVPDATLGDSAELIIVVRNLCTQAPFVGSAVRLTPAIGEPRYAATDSSGIARVRAQGGQYRLVVRGIGYLPAHGEVSPRAGYRDSIVVALRKTTVIRHADIF